MIRVILAFVLYGVVALGIVTERLQAPTTAFFLGFIVSALLISWAYELEKTRAREKPPLAGLTHDQNVRS